MKLKTLLPIIISLGLSVPGFGQVTNTAVRVTNTENITTSFSAADLNSMPQTTLWIKGEDDATHSYTGVDMMLLLTKAGVHLGAEARQQTLMSYLQITAADHYSVIYALPEIDSLFSDKKMILAHFKDAKPIPNNFGPLQIITTGEKKHARLIRQVETIAVTRVKQ